MRKFIDLVDALMETLDLSEDHAEATASRLMEMTTTDGYWKNPSAKELNQLAATQQLRGVAFDDNVYLGNAYTNVHDGMRRDLGLPIHGGDSYEDHGDDESIETFGFNFYVSGPVIDDNDIGWGGGESERIPDFEFADCKVFLDIDADEALWNRAFARMVTPRTETQPLREFLDSPVDLSPYNDGDLHGYTFHLDGREFFVGFNDEGDDEFYASFTGQDDRGRQSAVLLSHNKPFRVFSAVIAAFRKFIETNDPNMIFFDVDDAEVRRVTTYDRMLDMLTRQNALPDGYVWDRDANNRFMIFKDGHR